MKQVKSKTKQSKQNKWLKPVNLALIVAILIGLVVLVLLITPYIPDITHKTSPKQNVAFKCPIMKVYPKDYIANLGEISIRMDKATVVTETESAGPDSEYPSEKSSSEVFRFSYVVTNNLDKSINSWVNATSKQVTTARVSGSRDQGEGMGNSLYPTAMYDHSIGLTTVVNGRTANNHILGTGDNYFFMQTPDQEHVYVGLEPDSVVNGCLVKAWQLK